MPNPANPQSWNRYAYTNNSPINYKDPTGHKVEQEGGGICEGKDNLHECKIDFLHMQASGVVESIQGKTNRDDLEAMIDIIDLGTNLFDTNEELIPALSSVFLGLEESNALTVLHGVTIAEPCAAVGRPECSSLAFGDAGFHRQFRDEQSQPFHFWAYLATAANTEGNGPASYIPGQIMGNIANVYHEIIAPDGDGATWQDYALARAGMNIGTLVNMGVISPDQLGNTIRDYLGPSGPGAFYVDPLIATVPLMGN